MISTPFVLQIFRPEIEHEITQLQDQAAVNYFNSLKTSPLSNEIASQEQQVATLQAEAAGTGAGTSTTQSPALARLEQQRSDLLKVQNKALSNYDCQLYGPCKPPGNGPVAQKYNAQYQSDGSHRRGRAIVAIGCGGAVPMDHNSRKARRPRTARSSRQGSGKPDHDEHPETRRPGESTLKKIPKWLVTALIIPLVIAGVGWLLSVQQSHLADQHNDDVEATYLGDIHDLLFNQHLRTSPPDSEVRKVAIEKTVTTLKLLDAQRNVAVLRFCGMWASLARRTTLST